MRISDWSSDVCSSDLLASRGRWAMRPTLSAVPAREQIPGNCGEVAEWLKAPHSKCGIRATVSGVRIPPSPPLLAIKNGSSLRSAPAARRGGRALDKQLQYRGEALEELCRKRAGEAVSRRVRAFDMRRHRAVPAIADEEDEGRRPRAGDRSDHPAAPGVPVGAVVTGPGLAAHDHSGPVGGRSEEHTSELQSLMRISSAVFCLTKKNNNNYYDKTAKTTP